MPVVYNHYNLKYVNYANYADYVWSITSILYGFSQSHEFKWSNFQWRCRKSPVEKSFLVTKHIFGRMAVWTNEIAVNGTIPTHTRFARLTTHPQKVTVRISDQWRHWSVFFWKLHWWGHSSNVFWKCYRLNNEINRLLFWCETSNGVVR